MYRILVFICFLSLLIGSCTTSTSLFRSNNLHEEYGKKIASAGLKQTAMGRQWFAAADMALAHPQPISLPYKETGYFPADRPTAIGLQLAATRGEKIWIQLTKNPANAFAIYGDLWQINNNGKPSLAISFDTAQYEFSYEVKRTGNLIVRLQPELLKSGNYTIAITTGPSLAFPVAGNKGHIISYFGAGRDAGKRKHEGVDIAAPFRTPAIAPTNGMVSRVTENTLGGKVVFLQPANEDYSLYYAHLEEQLVTAGQGIKLGDTVGLIGNTGNAKNTVSHLHFGIYTVSGAIDPLPFIDPATKSPPDIKAPVDHLYEPYRLNSTVKSKDTSLKPLTYITPIAAMANDYRVILPNGQITTVPAAHMQLAAKPIKQMKAKQSERLFEYPDTTAPVIMQIAPEATIAILAYYNNFTYIRSDSLWGWIKNEGRY